MDEQQQILDNENAFLASYLMSISNRQNTVDERNPEDVEDYYDVADDSEDDDAETSSIYDDNFQYGLDESFDLFSGDSEDNSLDDNLWDDSENDYYDYSADDSEDNSFLDYLLGTSSYPDMSYNNVNNYNSESIGPGQGGLSVKDAIINNESGGNYKAVNPGSTATGKYQFIWSIWKDKIGAVTGVKSREDFLNDPQAQEKFYTWYEKNEMNPAVGRLRPYNNQNLTDVQLGRLFHYLGEKGSKDYLQGKTGDNPGGSNNPSISKYLAKYKQAGGSVPTDNTYTVGTNGVPLNIINQAIANRTNAYRISEDGLPIIDLPVFETKTPINTTKYGMKRTNPKFNRLMQIEKEQGEDAARQWLYSTQLGDLADKMGSTFSDALITAGTWDIPIGKAFKKLPPVATTPEDLAMIGKFKGIDLNPWPYATDVIPAAEHPTLIQEARLRTPEMKEKFLNQTKDASGWKTNLSYDELLDKVYNETQLTDEGAALGYSRGLSDPGTVKNNALDQDSFLGLFGKRAKNIDKAVTEAHEKTHGVVAQFSDEMLQDLKNSSIKKNIPGYKTHFPEEMTARMSMMKNALGMRGNEEFTKAQMDYLRNNYKSLPQAFEYKKIFDIVPKNSSQETQFIKNMNKYALGSAAVIGSAMATKKQTGGSAKPFQQQLPSQKSDNTANLQLKRKVDASIDKQNKPMPHLTAENIGAVKQAALNFMLGQQTTNDMFGLYNQLVDFKTAHIQNRNEKMSPTETAYRERLAKAFKYDYPYDPGDLKKGLDRFKNNQEQSPARKSNVSADSLRGELSRQYFGVNSTPNFIVESTDQPSQAQNFGLSYKDFSPEVKTSIANNYTFDDLVKMANQQQPTRTAGKDRYNAFGQLGAFKLSHGKDNRGEYISYWDNWDIDPPLLKDQGIDIDKLNYPFEVYGRLYKDEFQKKQYGGNIPVAYTSFDQYTGLNNDALDELILPLTGQNIIRGLDSGEPVHITDSTGAKYVLKGPNDTVKTTGKVYEKRLKTRK